MKGKLILFQGDSITDGNRYKEKSQEWDLNHQIGHAYPYVITATLGAKYPERGYVFKNRGVSGNGAAQLYGRWAQDCLNIRPDILSVLVGVNDLPPERGTDPDRFHKIYRLLLEEAREVKPDMRFILLEPFILPVRTYAEDWDNKIERLRLYQAAVKDVADSFGAIFVPLQDKFEAAAKQTGPDYWIWDGCHPTEAGHGLIAFEWLRLAEPIL